jgi:hypothetical protein
VLGVTAARRGALPPLAGWLLALSGVLVGLEPAIHSNAFFIAGAAVLLAAGIASGAALWRMTDAEFAAGSTAP